MVHVINIQGRNIDYQKDKLFFYDFEFKTENLKDICQKICTDKSLMDKIQGNEFKLKSKGLLNINKAKITVEENFTDRQFNDNELKKLNSNLNSLVLYGKLENLFNLRCWASQIRAIQEQLPRNVACEREESTTT